MSGSASPAALTCAGGSREQDPGCRVLLLQRLRRRAVPVPGPARGCRRLPAQAGRRRGTGPVARGCARRADRRRRHAGRPGRVVGGPDGQRGVLAGRADGAEPAGERGTRANRGRTVQPGDRHSAGDRRRDGEEPCPGGLPQAGGQRPAGAVAAALREGLFR